MKGFRALFRVNKPQGLVSKRFNQKWGLLLFPLVSIGAIPLLWSVHRHLELPSPWVKGDPSLATLTSTQASGEQGIETATSPPSNSELTLPPPSQIPAPPGKKENQAGLQAPRPVTPKSANKPTDSLPDPLPAAALNKPKEATPAAQQATTQSAVAQPSAPKPTKPVAKAPPSVKAPSPQVAAIAYTPPPLEIRVGVQRDVPSVTVATSQAGQILDRAGKPLMSLGANQGLTVRGNGTNLSINGKTVPGVVWVTTSRDGLVAVGDRWYRGRVLLVTRGNKVLAVNYVDLEHYLTSVVGSEMHSNAPGEALKAQAIAARSYALVHMVRPASDWFDLGDTQRWQVYKGIKSEFDTSHQAVNATVGQVLSHNGGVVESLYASTDEIVANVHKGRGMSQYGAYDLARQGQNYQQILNRYYPGVIVARVILKN